jgi:hypothetical protein
MNDKYKTYAIVAAVALLAIIIFNYVRKFILNVKGATNTVNSVIIAQTLDNAISQQTGITPERITELKTYALEISREMETNKDMSWTDTFTNIVEFSEVKKVLINVNSAKELQVLAAFYKDLFTASNNLYTDLEAEFSSSKLSQINFLSSIA